MPEGFTATTQSPSTYAYFISSDTLWIFFMKDTQDSLQEVAARHAEVAEFYKKNVSLVKSYERTADALQTLVVNNTRAVERLTAIIEHRSI